MKRAQAWIEGLRRTGIARFDELPGGAGARHYWRVSFEDGTSAVLMHALPEDPAILPPGLRSAPDEIPFVAMTAFLAQRGLPVPEIYAVDYDERWILLEDLGNTHLCDLPETSLVPRLREAVRLIARLHRATPEGELPFRRVFDREWIAFELQTFVEHGLRGSETGALREALDALAGAIEVLPRVVCLRDYQSQNLMIDARERLRILDYQDALLAPAELDLAALLHDSYIEIDASTRRELLDLYAEERGCPSTREALALLIVQRKCKDYGRYRLVTEKKGDARYAPFIQRARDSVLESLPQLPSALQHFVPVFENALQDRPA